MTRRFFISISISVCLIAAQLVGNTSLAFAASTTNVLLMGDSLGWEASNPFTLTTMAGHKANVHQLVFGGTALCDWLPALRNELSTWHPKAIAIEFSGNSFTPCMKNPATGQPYSGAALVAKYMADARIALSYIQPTGAQVWFEGLPTMRDAFANANSHAIGSGFAQMASQYSFTHYTPAGNALDWYQTPGKYVDFLPCLPQEPCPNFPFTRVRALDGIHFCPVIHSTVKGVPPDCPVWSSGAWRYGTAMSGPIIKWFNL